MTEAAGKVWLFAPPPGAPANIQDALDRWARENRIDPRRACDGVEVDPLDQVIRYVEMTDPHAPGAWRNGPDGVWRRRVTTPLLVEPPAELRRPPVGYARVASVVIPHAPSEGDALAVAVVEAANVWRSSGETADGHQRAEAALIAAVDAYRKAPPAVYVASPTPAAAYDWARYKRTCDPDRQLDGLGDLALFLGGSWSDTPGGSSFVGELLKLIVKAQSTPDRLAALEAGFPREVRAWRAWMASSPIPTAAELCATLTKHDNNRRVLLGVAEKMDRDFLTHIRESGGER